MEKENKILKNILKRKIKMTTAVLVAFLISGSLSFASNTASGLEPEEAARENVPPGSIPENPPEPNFKYNGRVIVESIILAIMGADSGTASSWNPHRNSYAVRTGSGFSHQGMDGDCRLETFHKAGAAEYLPR